MAGGIFTIIYLCVVTGVAILVLTMIWRFVMAHERIADSLEVIARKMRDGSGS